MINYIQQGFKGELQMWKYLVIPILFFGLQVLNLLVLMFMDIDVDSLIIAEIERKGADRFLIESLFPSAISLALVLFWVKIVHKQPLVSLTTSRKKIDWKRVFFAFSLWGGVIVLLLIVGYLFSPEDYVFNFKLGPFLMLFAISILLIPIQTSFEEYFFRGYLMQGLGIATKNRWFPLIFTSVVFGLLHIANPEVSKLGYEVLIFYIGTGFFFGIITLMDEGLELALGFHAANNLVTALLLTADWTVFQTNSLFIDVSQPDLISDVYFPVLVIFPIILFIFSKKYNWSNWKEKLTGKISKPIDIN